jgi:DNA repair exonuclease SbcCD ATPase subunit
MEMHMARQTGLVAAPTTTVVADQTLYGGTPQVNVQGFDVVDALPAAAADKLRALRQRADDLHMLVPEFDQVNELSIERIKADRDLKRLLASAQDGGFRLLDSDSRVKIAQKRLDKLTDDLARLRNLKETRTATWQVASRVLGNVEGWLKTGKPGNTSLVLFEEPEPKLAKGETLLDAIESRRRRVRELRADLARATRHVVC